MRTLVLLRDVAAVPVRFAHGLAMEQLNLGNVHFGTGRRQVSPSVFLAEAELHALRSWRTRACGWRRARCPREKSTGAVRAGRALGKGRVRA